MLPSSRIVLQFAFMLGANLIGGTPNINSPVQFKRSAFVHPSFSKASTQRPACSLPILFSFSSDAIPNTNGNAEEIARQLRQKAKDLRREATAEEQSLRKAVESKKEAEKRAADGWIDVLLGGVKSRDEVENLGNTNNIAQNNNIPSASTLAIRIKDNNLLSSSKLIKIVERLHDRETSMIIGPEAILSKPGTSGSFILGDYENNSLERKVDETQRITGLLDRVLEAVQLLDEDGAKNKLAPSLRVRVTELRQSREALLKRRIDGLMQSGKKGINSSDNVEDLVRSSLQGEMDLDEQEEKQRQEKMMKRLIETPPWLPPSLAAFAAKSPVEVPISTWKRVKSDLFDNTDFICTSWDANEVAAVFRGRLTREVSDTDDDSNGQMGEIFRNLVAKLNKHSELKDKVQLFLVDDNEWDQPLNPGFNSYKDTTRPSVIIALAKEVIPEQESERSMGMKSLATFSTLTTLLTTLAYALSSFALNPGFFNAIVNENDVTLVPLCLPIFFGVLAMSWLHEIGHYAVAKKYGVKLGWPVVLPSFQVGSFGCITPMRSFPSSRTAMFDVAMSGPGLTMLVSILMIVTGLILTTSATSFYTFPLVPAAVLKSSFLIGIIASFVTPKVMLLPLSQPVPVHPLFMIGLAGLVMSAVNLLPIGRLDGGRACVAVFGRKAASIWSFISLLMTAFYSFGGSNGVIIFWGALVVMTQRLPDIPAVDEVTGVNRIRSSGYVCLLILALLTLLPFP